MPGPISTMFCLTLIISFPYYMIKNARKAKRERRARIKARKEARKSLLL